jgi:hypothetical protein
MGGGARSVDFVAILVPVNGGVETSDRHEKHVIKLIFEMLTKHKCPPILG